MATFEKWLSRHGGTGVFVKTKRCEENDWAGGGRVFMAAGEIAPFGSKTIFDLVRAGRAIRDGNRITMKSEGSQAHG